ncbi:uncharacterized protein LOC8270577 isoform X1 [Ricinus communis]|uniref:uncharacterized protein LOC8270577 isoform X1 n=1 Tax=Ricinus communis TaxID=3988 RepID=UPI00201AD74D|nr:uncharacterized protein LOC8270577 isoform X1 [Ricinus communis]
MDNQDHRRNHSSGHDNHGVHVCHKCGWPFPNPHPSAKHRRAHKKICGTIEGYKLVQSEGSTHSTMSEDEHQSDEDHKTPSPRILERSSNEKGSGAIGDRSGRSEDEVFADAVAEFPDSGSRKVIEESPEDVKKLATFLASVANNDTRTTLSYEDDAITATISPPSSSADSSHMQNTEIQGSSSSGSAQDSRHHVVSVSIDFTERSLSGYRTEESMYESSDDKGGSTFDSNPIQLETETDLLQKNHEKIAGEVVPETDAKGNEETQNRKNNSNDDFIENDIKENEKINLDRQLLDVEVSPINNAGEVSEVSKLGKPEDKTSDPDAGAIQLKEQVEDKLDSDISLNRLSPEVESVELMNSSIHTSQIKEDAVPEVASGCSGSFIETSHGEERGSEEFHMFSVSGDIPEVENAEAMIQGFKDLNGGRLSQLVNVDSLEISNEVKEPVLKDNASVSKGTEVSVSDMHVLEDKLEQTGEDNELVVDKFPDETEDVMPPVKVTVNASQRREEFDDHAYAPESEVGKSYTVRCPEEQLPVGKSSSQTSSSEHASKVLTDINPVTAPMDAEVGQIIDTFDVDDAGDDEKSRVEKCDIAENERCRRIKEECCMENLIANSEEGEVESYCASETKTGEDDPILGSMDGNHLLKTTMPKSADGLLEKYITSENVTNASGRNLSEAESIHLSSTSNNQEDVKELESNGNERVLVEDAANANAGAQSDNVGNNYKLPKSSDSFGDVELLQKPSDNIDKIDVLQKPPDKIEDVHILHKSSEEHVTQETQLSPLGISSSIQNYETVGDNPARDFVGAASENQSEPFPDDGENKFSTQQLGASVTDLSVDSGSQTDSLEGHWGSVSVLSTQSDMPTVVDTEPMASNGSKASAEAERTDLKKTKPFLEGQQQSDKSDIFEPPSFMTLVEPRDGDKAAASEIQTVQNMQQPNAASLQAGWFPSLTHVVNESQGRKKNEERIAKVTNWSTGKQHTPLKSLLGEANAETKSKLPNTKENLPPVVQNDEASTKDHGSSPTPNLILGTQMNVAESIKKDAGKEWNSPARYPADIKREKRKVKGRPYWAQFVCCSSVN